MPSKSPKEIADARARARIGTCSGMILNNYANSDVGAAAARLLMGVAVGGAFPLLFDTARTALGELRPSLARSRETLTRSLIAAITAVSLAISDVSQIS